MEWPVILLLLGGVAMAKSLNYIADIYEIDPTQSQVFFQNAVMDTRTRKIYVGAKNRLYELDENLQVLTEVITGPEPDNIVCPIAEFSCENPKVPTDSFSKALLIDEVNNYLIHCISLYQGVCRKHDIDSIKRQEDPIHTALVANNDSATTFAFIAPGPIEYEKDKYLPVINIGVQYTNKGWKRDRVPCFASRNLDDFDIAYKGISIFKTETMLDSNTRQLFPILYVYGFGSEGFSYMITVQKQSVNTESYISKLFRVCQRDKFFYSYAEVHLQCWHNGALYNLAQSAYLGRAGKQLAKTLDIPDTEDVLYVTFSMGSPRSYKPLQDSALCVYPMRYVRNIFTRNIQECFKGNGNTGPSHFFSSSPCVNTPKLEVDDNYCGKFEETNVPTDGMIPVTSHAAALFQTTVSAISVDVVNDYTVAFVGSKKGHIYKVVLETKEVGMVFEDVALAEGQEIKPSMFVDLDHEHLYVVTEYKLMKMKLYDCSQYKTCGTCLNASDPYCGWCSLENKCSLRKECTDSDQVLRWLPYSGSSCPSITSVVPSQIQKEPSHSKTTQDSHFLSEILGARGSKSVFQNSVDENGIDVSVDEVASEMPHLGGQTTEIPERTTQSGSSDVGKSTRQPVNVEEPGQSNCFSKPKSLKKLQMVYYSKALTVQEVQKEYYSKALTVQEVQKEYYSQALALQKLQMEYLTKMSKLADVLIDKYSSSK